MGPQKELKMAFLLIFIASALIGAVNSKDCSDTNPSCDYFNNQGFCTTGPYIAWMKKVCRKTCGVCDFQERCPSNPCKNGGQCTEGDKNFKCTCADGFFGPTCESSKDCSDKHRSCDYFKKQGSCETNEWVKKQCKKTCDVCDFEERCPSNPCKNGGQCQETDKSFKCTCADGWVGATCEQNPCQSKPCKNGGKCEGSVDGFYCYCAEGWTGRDCTKALTKIEKAVLVRHNELRKKVATEAEPAWKVKCSNLKDLSWSQDLATSAQQWADHMASEDKMYHDDSSNRKYGTHQGYIGQNIAYQGVWGTTETNFNEEEIMLKMVQAWYDEVNDLNGQDPNDYKKNGGSAVIGHFTQVVWEGTTEVGCGYGKMTSGKVHKWYFACNYSPGGNINVKENNPCTKD